MAVNAEKLDARKIHFWILSLIWVMVTQTTDSSNNHTINKSWQILLLPAVITLWELLTFEVKETLQDIETATFKMTLEAQLCSLSSNDRHSMILFS